MNKRWQSMSALLIAGVLVLSACSPGRDTPSGTTTQLPQTTTQAEVTEEIPTETVETEETETQDTEDASSETNEPTETEDTNGAVSGDFRYQDYVIDVDPSIEYPLQTDKTLVIWTDHLRAHEDYLTPEESPFSKNLVTQTGVEIVYVQNPAGTDGTQALNTMLAGGDLTDIIYTNNLHLNINTFIEDNIALTLDEIMPENAPDAYSLIDAYPELQKSLRTDDGNLYAFPFLRGDPWLGNWLGQAVDQDVLDELGMDVPETLEDWDEYLHAAKPIVDIPLALRTGTGLFDLFANAFNFNQSYYIGDDGRIHYGFGTPEYKEFLTHMKGWYDDGLIDPDFVTMDATALNTKVINNSIAAIHLATGTFVNFHVARQEVGGEFNFTPAPVAVSQVDGAKKFFPGESPWTGKGALITTAAEDPVLAAQFLNYGYTNEGMLFWNFGMEGESYEMVNGEPQLTPLILDSAEGATRALRHYSAMVGDGFSVMMKELNDQKNVPLGDTGIRIGSVAGDVWTDGTEGVSHRIPTISPTLQENQEFSAITNAMDTYALEMYYNFLLGTEPIESFDSYITILEEMGLERALEIRNAQLDRYNAR